MKTAIKASSCLLALLVIGFIWSCGSNTQQTNTGPDNNNAAKPAVSPAVAGVDPVPFPNPGIPGFNFPEQTAVIDAWAKDAKYADIYNHGWGIWAGLTTVTTQVPPGGTEPLMVFETWSTPDEMIAATNNDAKKSIAGRLNRANLGKPNQFKHALEKGDKSFETVSTTSKPTGGNTNAAKTNTSNTNTGNKNSNANAAPVAKPTPDTTTAESVSYSPAAAKHAIDNKLFMWDALKAYADKGMTDIPAFPSDAITIKPVFKVIQKSTLGPAGLYPMYSWHGPIDTVAGYPENAWKSCIYVDINNGGKGDGSQDMTCTAPSSATTYNVKDFIHYTLNQEDADYYNQEFGLNAVAGDTAILVAMHVTTRETAKWTWQSFYWAPNPADPKAPSSPEIAKARPAQITGAPAHYAMTVAYAMVFPVQPDTGGESVGDTIIGFNPYLEAGFSPKTFTGSHSYVVKNNKKIMTDAGVRTNCMSCHVYATVSAADPCKSTTPYSGDAYVSLDDPAFKGQLKLDFAWSIQSNVQKDGKPCPQ